MGDASISCPRATLICHHELEEDTKVFLENVHIEVTIPKATHIDMTGKTSTVSTGLPQLTITAYAGTGSSSTISVVDPKHPPKPVTPPDIKRIKARTKKKPLEVPLSERPETFGSF